MITLKHSYYCSRRTPRAKLGFSLKGQTEAKMRTGQEQNGPGLASVEQDSSGGRSATPSDARTSPRRSSRLPVAIPVLVYAHEENGETSYAEGKTLSVSVHGGLLAVAVTPNIGQAVLLTNSKTEQEIVCHVRSVKQIEGGVNHVGVEFATESPTFWDIAFPSEDRDLAGPEPPQYPPPPKPPVSQLDPVGSVDKRSGGPRTRGLAQKP